MTNPDDLERLARAAIDVAHGEPWYDAQDLTRTGGPGLLHEDAAFIAAANPATILALLSANREMRAALERIASGLPGVRAVHRFTEAQLTARSALTTQRGDGE